MHAIPRSMTWRYVVHVVCLIVCSILLTASCKAQVPLNFNIDPISSTLDPNISTASAVVTGDFNGDGKADLAILAQVNTITVLLGTGNGAFTAGSSPAATSATSSAPVLIVAADFNGDGKLDIATANSDGTLTVFAGNGDGTFATAASSSLPSTSFASMLIGDFNGDGKPDILLADNTKGVLTDPLNATVLLGNGDGTFKSSSFSLSMINQGPIAVGDFNGDGRTDIAVGGQPLTDDSDKTGVITILLSKGDGTFTPGFSQPTTGAPIALVAADFNADGKQDIVAGTLAFPADDDPMGSYKGSSIVLLGNGDGTFTARQTGTIPGAGIFAVADFNGDGKPDFAEAMVGGNPIDLGSTSEVQIELGDGAGGFTASPLTTAYSPALDTSPLGSPGVLQKMVAADFNGDGKPDLAVVGGEDVNGHLHPAVLLYPPPIILSSNGVFLPDAILNMPYSQTITASGGTPPYIFTASGLAAGLSISSGGTISGTPTAAGEDLFTLMVQDSSPGKLSGSSDFGINVVAPGFTVTSSSTSATVTAGQAAKYTLSFAPVAGFSSPVSLTCSGLPSDATCSFSNATVTPGPTTPTSILTVTTRATTTSLNSRPAPPFPLGTFATAAGGASLASVLLIFVPRCRRLQRYLPILLLGLMATGLISACGGGGAQRPPVTTTTPGTPPGSYTINVTATQTSSTTVIAPIVQTTPLTLVVQ